MPSALEKLKILKAESIKRGLDIELEVDGGINDRTAQLAVEAGASVLVVGSYLFNSQNLQDKVKELKSINI